MDSRSMHCCGTKELMSLSTHYDPFLAMMGFVTLWKKGEDHSGFKAPAGTMYSNYIFTAAVYDQEVCESHIPHAYLQRGDLWDKARQMYFPYGHNFAAFLVKHQLGTVSTVPATFNKAFHTDHKVQAWIWSPDPKAVEKWATRYNFSAYEKLGLLACLANISSNYLAYDKYKAKKMDGSYHKSYIDTNAAVIKTKLAAERKKDATFTLYVPPLPAMGIDFSEFA